MRRRLWFVSRRVTGVGERSRCAQNCVQRSRSLLIRALFCCRRRCGAFCFCFVPSPFSFHTPFSPLSSLAFAALFCGLEAAALLLSLVVAVGDEDVTRNSPHHERVFLIARASLSANELRALACDRLREPLQLNANKN